MLVTSTFDRSGYFGCDKPYKLTRERYSSLTRYRDHLKRLEWVERTNYTEPFAVQHFYPPASPRVQYRLTENGKETTDTNWSDRIMALYRYTGAMRSGKRTRCYQ